MILTELYQESALIKLIDEKLQSAKVRLHVDGMTGSLPAVVIASLAQFRIFDETFGDSDGVFHKRLCCVKKSSTLS